MSNIAEQLSLGYLPSKAALEDILGLVGGPHQLQPSLVDGGKLNSLLWEFSGGGRGVEHCFKVVPQLLHLKPLWEKDLYSIHIHWYTTVIIASIY